MDRLWRLSTPIGETTDHPLVNPFGPASPSLESVAFDPVLVVVAGNDLLRDRAEEYARRLKEWGKKFKYIEFEGEDHGFAILDPNCEAAKQLMQDIKQFLDENLEL